MYSSQRMKDWNNIISLYQKNNIYLAEVASFLQRNATYEIPSLKKQIARTQQMQKVSFIRSKVFCKYDKMTVIIIRNAMKNTIL
jgi:hypothetical protein